MRWKAITGIKEGRKIICRSIKKAICLVGGEREGKSTMSVLLQVQGSQSNTIGLGSVEITVALTRAPSVEWWHGKSQQELAEEKIQEEEVKSVKHIFVKKNSAKTVVSRST